MLGELSDTFCNEDDYWLLWLLVSQISTYYSLIYWVFTWDVKDTKHTGKGEKRAKYQEKSPSEEGRTFLTAVSA